MRYDYERGKRRKERGERREERWKRKRKNREGV